MARKSTTTATAEAPAPAIKTPTARQLADALRYLARVSNREAEIAQLLGDDPK